MSATIATDQIVVRALGGTPAEAAAWDAFVDRHDGSTSDHWWAWQIGRAHV